MASEYLKWKYRDVKPDEPVTLTRAQRRKNWWDYHKWHVVIAVALAWAALSVLTGAVRHWRDRCDYQIAYVGSAPMPEDTRRALEAAIAALGEDCDGDGRVAARIHQYVDGSAAEQDDPSYAYAASVTLTADLAEGESYFFLLEDPEAFQRGQQALRRLDGALPGGDEDAADVCLKWSDCPVLAGLELGGYEESALGQTASGDSQQWLSDLYFARRGFWSEGSEREEASRRACDDLWDELTKGADAP